MDPDASPRIPPPASKIPPPPARPATSVPPPKQVTQEPSVHIALKDVRKAFGPKQVLNGVNLDIPRGQSVVIIGGSGTGKSVTLKCILGILQPDSGSILVNGKETVGQSARVPPESETAPPLRLKSGTRLHRQHKDRPAAFSVPTHQAKFSAQTNNPD